jgi:hypothetical protein
MSGHLLAGRAPARLKRCSARRLAYRCFRNGPCRSPCRLGEVVEKKEPRPWIDFSGPLQKRDTFKRSKRTLELRSVCCRSTGIRSEQSSEASSAWWPYLKVALALPLFALNRLAKSLGCCDARVGALATSGVGDGEESWSEDDLFDLDSTLSFGARIGEIAVFLRREVEDVETKAFKRNLPNSAKLG